MPQSPSKSSLLICSKPMSPIKPTLSHSKPIVSFLASKPSFL